MDYGDGGAGTDGREGTTPSGPGRGRRATGPTPSRRSVTGSTTTKGSDRGGAGQGPFKHAVMRADTDGMSTWNVVVGHFLTRNEVASLTGLPAGQVRTDASLLRIGSALSSEEVYPACQFDRAGHTLPSLDEMLERMGEVPPFEIACMLSTPAEELGGKTPAAWLHAGGDLDRVVHLAA